MANDCSYTMYAEGKPEAIDELIARMTFKYDHSEGSEVENRTHFWRVFEANVEDLEPRSEGTRLVAISGYCAWSVNSCMCDGPLTYAGDWAKDPEIAPYCTSLKKTSDELGIEIEVFSEEPSMEFAEHYHYVPNGRSVEEECEYHEVWWDRDEGETFAELDEEYDLTAQGITEQDFADEDYVTIGGFGDLTPFCYQKSADEGNPTNGDTSVGRVEDVKASIAEIMTQVGENCCELDGSDDFGYVQEWDNGHIRVAWHNYCEMEDMAGILYPGDQWGPGRYAVESSGCEGGVEPERLVDVMYVIVPEDGSDAQAFSVARVKGLADTLEHAETVVKWAAEHGQQMRWVGIN